MTQPNTTAPHALTPEQTLQLHQSKLEGLSNTEAKTRLEKHGENQLPKGKTAGPLEILWGQINSPLIWVLIGSGALAIAVDPHNGLKNGLVILGVVALNTLIGFIQEFRAAKAIEALGQMVPENANTYRDGKLVSLPSSQLVHGDIVQLASGDKVPADMRLIQSKSLRIDEAALTGESLPVEKNNSAVEENSALGDRLCMTFGGTLVTYGSGLGVVTATGSQTELGRINEMMNTATGLETPLTRSLKKIGKLITIGISILAFVILGVGTYRVMNEAGLSLFDAFRETVIFSIALAVGAIPEGLPAIVTIALAIGVQRMASRRAVVRKLPSVETLGSTTVICSDKTGTLTRNEMTVQEIFTADGQSFTFTGVGYGREGEIRQKGNRTDLSPAGIALLEAGVLCNDSSIHRMDEKTEMSGDPTEFALLVAGEKAGFTKTKLYEQSPRVDVIPFESENQFMASLHKHQNQFLMILKGAPEVVLKRCEGLTEEKKKEIHNSVSDLAAKGLRVLAFATRTVDRKPESFHLDSVENGFSFAGLQAMIDPPREEAIRSIQQCHLAGIKVKMITGDHPETAEAIGRMLGILQNDQRAITGVKLAQMNEDQLKAAAVETNVFARVAPEHKLRLVKALQDQGEVVAMTGDGVNDAPALKQSNIGVAMGITGTSVSKEAADIILTDDNFATITAAVEEGRKVYDNLIKSLAFVLPTNLGLALILVYAIFFFPFRGSDLLVPILPVQILWINLVGAVALALPLAFEAKERDVMERPPRNLSEPLLSRFVIFRTVLVAILMTAGAVSLFNYEYNSAIELGMKETIALAEAQTLAVTTVIFFQIFYMLNCRSLKESVFSIGVFSNKTVFPGIAVVLILQAGLIYFEPLQRVFNTASLPFEDLLRPALIGASIVPLVSIEKFFRSRKDKKVPANLRFVKSAGT